jgi:hypothetical protein
MHASASTGLASLATMAWGGMDSFHQALTIPHLIEFCAVAERSVSLHIRNGKPGTIDRVPPFLAKRLRNTLSVSPSAWGAR